MVNLTLGLFIAIVAGAMFSIGTALQKKAAAALPRIESQPGVQNVKNFLSNRTWLLGIILATAQWYIALLAMPLLPLSLLSSLMGVNLAILVVFSHFYLKEPVKRADLTGMAMIIAGVVILGLKAHKLETKITLAEMTAFFSEPRAILYTALLLAGVVAPVVYSRTKMAARGDVAFGLSAGFLLAVGQIYSKAFMSGFNEGQSLAATAKTFAWWIFILLLAVGNLGSMVALQYGFQKGKAVVVASLAQVIGAAGGMLGGVVIFSEWNGLAAVTVGLKIAAVVAILAGVAILSRSSQGHLPQP
jgi:drug/metabolite transporter (DMT)-like permease